MVRLIFGLILVLLVASPCMGQQSLVGTYKIVSQVVEVGGAPTEPLGRAPHGYLVLTPTHAVAFYTGDVRKFGTSVAEKAALFDTVVGWSGMYRIEGGRIAFAIDASWVENLNGKDQVRNWSLSGKRLAFTSDPRPSVRDPSKTSIVRQVWEKVD
jgi:hypothetical protein